jgi:hypothetical protein
MSTDADFTLEELWAEGIGALSNRSTRPGTTYEVAPGIVGEMPWPTLQTREEVQELREGLQKLFKENATSEQFQALSEATQGGRLDEDSSPIREGVTAQEFEKTAAAVNCKQTARLLEFDEEVEPHDIVPDMAAVVATHFTKLRAGSGGQAPS